MALQLYDPGKIQAAVFRGNPWQVSHPALISFLPLFFFIEDGKQHCNSHLFLPFFSNPSFCVADGHQWPVGPFHSFFETQSRSSFWTERRPSTIWLGAILLPSFSTPTFHPSFLVPAEWQHLEVANVDQQRMFWNMSASGQEGIEKKHHKRPERAERMNKMWIEEALCGFKTGPASCKIFLGGGSGWSCPSTFFYQPAQSLGVFVWVAAKFSCAETGALVKTAVFK